MGKPEIEALLNMLVNERHVAASTHKQALSALCVRLSPVNAND
jgi:hypothetical protein